MIAPAPSGRLTAALQAQAAALFASGLTWEMTAAALTTQVLEADPAAKPLTAALLRVQYHRRPSFQQQVRDCLAEMEMHGYALAAATLIELLDASADGARIRAADSILRHRAAMQRHRVEADAGPVQITVTYGRKAPLPDEEPDDAG